MKMDTNYNQELILAHQHIKKEYEKFINSNRIKSNPERLAWSHAVQIIGYIAYNCNITKKPNPNNTKRPEFYNTPLEK